MNSRSLMCGLFIGLNSISFLVHAQQPSTKDSPSETVRVYIEQFAADVRSLNHRFRLPLDSASMDRRRNLMNDWLIHLREIDFDTLDTAGQVDYLLLRGELEYRLSKQKIDWERDVEAAKLIPYVSPLLHFCKAREDVTEVKPTNIATILDAAADAVDEQLKTIKAIAKSDLSQAATEQRLTALRASELLSQVRITLREAHGFYEHYDPLYSWWAKQPMERLLAQIEKHRVAIREKLVGVADSDQDTIIGLPIGAEGLKLELDHEWIALQPDELVAVADREMKWCDEQMVAASTALGFGNDWHKALEHVKSKHVEPGQQPAMIRDLAWEAIRFLEANDLITVPPMAAQGWRMTMMSPERQRVNPYFLGGDTIIVSYPTDTMTHEEKLMSMRSNNEHFSRATVHHELIPGHHLQYHMLPRYRPYRSLFATPFWMEGWALYWEMLLWDLDFAKSNEDRVGMLFWRRHRCARIVFSLNYHLGKMTPEQCIDYLVERVGHERSAATAEVRRSIMGGYSPLYQAAYMVGGLQLRNLHRELVLSGKLSNRQFHDAVLREHSIPIELLRAQFTSQALMPDSKPSWKWE
jgi:uncharacterized protein (DUF885 family)